MTAAEVVAEARRHLAVARSMQRNLRLGLYQGRNGGGGTAAIREAKAEGLLRGLLDQPDARAAGSWQRRLYARVWADHDLSIRLSEARDNGMDRPELRSRQQLVRRQIRELIA